MLFSLRRVLAFVDRELGPVAVSQFGTASLSELLAAGELEFASREPAVRAYGAAREAFLASPPFRSWVVGLGRCVCNAEGILEYRGEL